MLTFCSGRPSAGRKCATAAKPKGIQNIFTQLWSGGLVDPHLVDLELWANHITAKHEAVFRPMQDELVVLANRIRDTLSGTASSTTTFDTSRLNSLPSLSYNNRLGKVPGPFPLASPSLQLAACPCRHGYVTPCGVGRLPTPCTWVTNCPRRSKPRVSSRQSRKCTSRLRSTSMKPPLSARWFRLPCPHGCFFPQAMNDIYNRLPTVHVQMFAALEVPTRGFTPDILIRSFPWRVTRWSTLSMRGPSLMRSEVHSCGRVVHPQRYPPPS